MSAGDALGLERGRVRVVPYDTRWPLLFAEMARRIRDRLGDAVHTIEHVGSTAVPGLSAKPILDMLAAVPDFESARALAPRLATLGFEYRPNEEIHDRHYFRRYVADCRTHHFSLAEPASRHYRHTVAFRDALREDPALRNAYDVLKRQLAELFPNDRGSYIEGKTEFVLSVLRARGVE